MLIKLFKIQAASLAITFFCAINISAETSITELRFTGIDYRYTMLQTPSSDKYSLKGIDISNHSISADISYIWPFSSGKTALFASILYDNSLYNSEIDRGESERLKSDVPEYLYSLPNLHEFQASLVLGHEMRNDWSYSVGTDLFISSDFEGDLGSDAFSSTLSLLFAKNLGTINLGAGSYLYLRGDEFTALPALSFSYYGEVIEFDLLIPVGMQMDFILSERTRIGINGEFISNGYSVNYDNSKSFKGKLPDFIDQTGLDMSLFFDRNFWGPLHYRLTTGYSYREMEFRANDKAIDELTFEKGLFGELSLFYNF